MLRSVTLGLVLSVLAVACALVEQPVPAGTRPVEVRVRNETPAQVKIEFDMQTGGTLHEAVQTASVSAVSTTDVTLYVPIDGRWAIVVNGMRLKLDASTIRDISRGCTLVIDVPAAGDVGYGCE